MKAPDLVDPFRIEGPALISFSGGRTSAYMLWRVLQAHAGALPPNTAVTFANTGKEVEATLRFVHECSDHWGVPVVWLEWRREEPGFEVVGYNSASREGEPFQALIDWKKALPNWQARWCTGFLKVSAMHAFMRVWGGREPGQYAELIGLRHDEPSRIADMVERNERDKRLCTAPLAKAWITERDVMDFWAEQPFDLGIRPGEGNCDLCFLKGRALKKALISANPACAKWWLEEERDAGATFDRRDSIEKLVREVRAQPTLFDDVDAAEFDVECGLMCAGNSA